MAERKYLKKPCIFIDNDRNTVLHEAAAYGDLDKVKTLISENHKIDPENYLGWTPLMMATRNCHFEIVNFLLEHRANSTHNNRFGFSVFLIGISSGRIELLHLILQHVLKGGVSWACIQTTFSPISLAVLFNNIEIVQYLLQHSFCVNGIGSLTDITPLAFANVVGNLDIIRLLLSKGAQTTVDTTPAVAPTVPNSPLLPLLPYIFMQSPDGQCYPGPAEQSIQRKCSNLLSPNFTPNISPFTPMEIIPQMFFPPNFSTVNYLAPTTYPEENSDVFNMPINSPYLSPNSFNHNMTAYSYEPHFTNYRM